VSIIAAIKGESGEESMNDNLLKILQDLTARYGAELLDDGARVKALLADFAKGEPKAQKTAFLNALGRGCHKSLREVPKTERGAACRRLAQNLHDEEGLDLTLCGGTLELLAALLFAGEPETPLCPAEQETAPEEADEHAKIISAKNAEITRLTSGINRLTRERDQSAAALRESKEAHESLGRKLFGVVFFGLVAVVISIGVGYSKYTEMEGRYYSLSNDYYGLMGDYNKSKEIWALNVTKLEAGNADSTNRWITKPGEPLNAAGIRYFNPVITVDSLINGEVVLYIKLISPSGITQRNTETSPEGYTYSKTKQVNRGRDQVIDLDGWGNAEKSVYSAGEWTVEVWYNGACLCSETVMLN
jgi:hypothetical protein